MRKHMVIAFIVVAISAGGFFWYYSKSKSEYPVRLIENYVVANLKSPTSYQRLNGKSSAVEGKIFVELQFSASNTFGAQIKGSASALLIPFIVFEAEASPARYASPSAQRFLEVERKRLSAEGLQIPEDRYAIEALSIDGKHLTRDEIEKLNTSLIKIRPTGFFAVFDVPTLKIDWFNFFEESRKKD